MSPSTPEEPAKEDKEQRAVQSIEVGGRLLLALANSQTPLTLKELSSRLVELHGQHEHQTLLDPGTHLSATRVRPVTASA